MFDIAKFSAEVRDNRDSALALMVENPRMAPTYREALRIVVNEDVWNVAEAAAFTAPTFDDHKAAFFGASRCVPDYARPTDKQIDYLAKLAADVGELSVYRGSLTKQAASNLINEYLK